MSRVNDVKKFRKNLTKKDIIHYGINRCNFDRDYHRLLANRKNACGTHVYKTSDGRVNMFAIPEPLVKKIPYVGPVLGTVGLVLDVKDIAEN